MPGPPNVPPGVETLANADLAAVAAAIDAIQAGELANDGRYWQGLPSHTVTPSDGNTAAADRMADKPSDRGRAWSDVGVAVGTRRISVRCDEYEGPTGLGYVVTGRISMGGSIFERSIATGPETHRDSGGVWSEVEVPV